MADAETTIQVEVEDIGPCSKKVSITVPAARVDREIEETFKNVMRSVTFPGFRQGKAPRKLVEAKLGDRVLSDVKERLVQTAVDEAIADNDLKPVGNAHAEWENIDLARNQDLAFDVTLDVRPEFDLPDLSEIVVERPTLEITDEHVDADIERLRRSHATVEDGGDDPLEENGHANLHIKLEVDGEVVIETGDIEWEHPDPSLGGMELDELPALALGKAKGDQFELQTTLPDNFFEEQHRGKEASITLTIESTRKVKLPEVTDEWVAEMDFDDVAELRDETRRRLERTLDDQKSRALDDAITAALLEAIPFDVPPSLVEQESQRMLARYQMQLHQDGVAEKEIVAALREAKAEAETRVKRDLRASFILDRVASDRKVFVTENEVQTEVARMASSYQANNEDMMAYLERQNMMPTLRGSLRERKTVRELHGVMKIVDAPAEEGK